MKYVKLGNSELEVSRVCMGCMSFGDPQAGAHSWTLNESDSKEIIKHGLDLGVNFFDTAIAYQGGTSEEYVGRILRSLVKREDVIVATKFHPRSAEEIANGESAREHIRKNLELSLKHLGMDYVDLYILHRWDYTAPPEETMGALDEMIKAGKVRAIGVSNCYAYQLAKANAIAEREGFNKFVSVQGHYNLLFREEEREMARLCREENIAMTPYSALASGRLARLPGENSKRLQQDTYAKGKYDATAEQDEMIIRRVAEIAERRGVSMTEVSLAWLMTKVTAPVVGATKLHHVDGAVKAVDLQLTDDECAYLEELYVPHKLVGVMAQV